MAFNITGGITLTNSVAKAAPNAPVLTSPIQHVDQSTALLEWNHTPNPSAPQSGFRIENRQQNISDPQEWAVYAQASPAPLNVEADNATNSYEFQITNVAELAGNHEFRVTATGSQVGSATVDSVPSNTGTLNAFFPDIPEVVRVENTNVADVKRICWDYTASGEGRTTHFELQQTSSTTILSQTDIDTRGDEEFLTVASIPANTVDPGITSRYCYTNTGYASETNYVYYRVRAFFRNGTAGEYSDDFTDPFNPFEPLIANDVLFTRQTLDLGILSWKYTGTETSEARAFIVESRRVGISDFSTFATVDAGSDLNVEITGLNSEMDSITFRIRVLGTNGQIGDPSPIATFTPDAPNPVTGFLASVNEGVGLVTSIDLTWTAPQADVTKTSATAYLIEYQKENQPYQQIGTFAGDLTRVEILPPQPGEISVRITTIGANGLSSPTSPTVLLTATSGSATDDAIYNGDDQFIAAQHFRVPANDICLDSQPGTSPLIGIDPAAISGGTLTAPTATEAGFVEGQANQNLVIEWNFEVSAADVTNSVHYYLNLDGVEPQNNPTRDWDVDTGNVILEIISNPTLTNRFYETAAAGLMYFGSVDAPNDADDVRFYTERATGAGGQDEPMYVSRVRIQLNMRKVFTFRAEGLVTLRATFLADSVGYPRIPVSGTTLQNEADTPICLEAYRSDAEDSGVVSLTFDADAEVYQSVINLNTDYEIKPSVTLGSSRPGYTWYNLNETYTTATIFWIPLATLPAGVDVFSADDTVDLSYYVRGY